MLVVDAHHPFEIFILFFEPFDFLLQLLNVMFLPDPALFSCLTISASLLMQPGLGLLLYL